MVVSFFKILVEAALVDFIMKRASLLDSEGHRLVVRNGHHPERSIQTGMGNVTIKKLKIDGRRIDKNGERLRSGSQITPPRP